MPLWVVSVVFYNPAVYNPAVFVIFHAPVLVVKITVNRLKKTDRREQWIPSLI